MALFCSNIQSTLGSSRRNNEKDFRSYSNALEKLVKKHLFRVGGFHTLRIFFGWTVLMGLDVIGSCLRSITDLTSESRLNAARFWGKGNVEMSLVKTGLAVTNEKAFSDSSLHDLGIPIQIQGYFVEEGFVDLEALFGLDEESGFLKGLCKTQSTASKVRAKNATHVVDVVYKLVPLPSVFVLLVVGHVSTQWEQVIIKARPNVNA